MTPLRSAVHAYLAMRRDLGFHLRDAGRLLLQFVAFMEQHRASVITTPLALAWAQHPQTVQPAEWARRLSIVRIFARYRMPLIPGTKFRRMACCRIAANARDPTSTPMRRSVTSCTRRSTCPATMNVGRYARGCITACSGS